MLQVQGLTKGYAGRVLFDNITWNVNAGQRVGLVGPNGSGKTTLLRLFTGKEPADNGSVTMPKRTTVGYLPQEGLHHSGRTLRDEAMTAFGPVLALGDELRKLEAQMSHKDHLDPDSKSYQDMMTRYGECQEEWDRREGFTIESRVDVVLAGLGFTPKELDAPTESFSGGWQMRIALAKLLLERPDLLLLDEPTNHLDLEARNWLEDYLAAYPHAVVMVSHDRYFLDRVVTRITEIDRRKLVDYTGNYTSYLKVGQQRLQELRARAARQRDEMEKMQRFVDRFRAKASKAKQVQSRVKMLEKMTVIEVPPERKLMRLRLPEPERPGRIVLELDHVDKAYGTNIVFSNAQLLIERGERMALVGPNGAGKSTLMRLLADAEAMDAGERKVGHKVKVAYFSQERYDLNLDKTVLENLTESAPVEMVPQLRNILGAFLFHGDDVDKRVKVLSGGEKSRVALARLLLRPANVLLLDEPTNHLDLDSKEVLLEALDAYKGTLVFVSHDRYFLDTLTTKVAEIGGGAIHLHWGGYPEFIAAKENQAQEALERRAAAEAQTATPEQQPPPKQQPVRKPPVGAPKAALSKNQARQLKKRLEELEEEISETEIAVDSLEARMAVPGFYDSPEASTEVVRTHEALKKKLAELYAEWEELGSKTPA